VFREFSGASFEASIRPQYFPIYMLHNRAKSYLIDAKQSHGIIRAEALHEQIAF
jgi:hypothetical protein